MRERAARRREAEKRGRSAEIAALLLLAAKGWLPLARRVKTPVGEIDLVVRRARTLAFVEVMRRANAADALASVTHRQRARILRAAEWWLARNPSYGGYTLRF
ncbi:MAG: YraN family protein, partial [Flavobacteriaceae bacterium]